MTARPTLLLVAPFPPTQGPEADKAYYLSRQLAAHGWRVHVATTRDSVLGGHAEVTIHAVVREWSWDEAGLLTALVEQTAPDVLVIFCIDWLYQYQPMVTFLPTLARAVRPTVSVLAVFDDVFQSQPWDQPAAVRLGRQRMKRWAGLTDVDDRYGTLLRDSDQVIVVSHRVGDELVRRVPELPRKLAVVPTPPILPLTPFAESEREQHRARLGLKPDEFLLVYFGYLTQGKGVETLLRAFAQVCQQRDDARLILIGGTIPEPEHVRYADEVRQLPRLLDLADRVSWTGAYAWDSMEPSQLLHAADVCVLPYDAGVCLHNCSFAGAAAHGLPILTTRGPDLETAFADRANVLLCPPEDPTALGEALQTLLKDAPLRDRLRAGVRALAQEWFNWDKALERMGLRNESSLTSPKR
jgi:glycosyltransferase involved in cell wall biosynthesis